MNCAGPSRTPWLALVASLLFACSGPPDQVDRSFTVVGDVTGSGVPQTITVRIRGQTPQSPYRLELKVTDAKGRELHREESRGDDFDSFFGRDWLVHDCQGYDACKAKWYFEDVPRLLRASFVAAEHALLVGEQAFYEQMDGVATRDLLRMGLAESRIPAVLQEMRGILGKPGFRLLAPVSRPMGDHGDAKVWVPGIARFVSCYDP